LHPDLAAVQLDELPRERQPEARALVLLRVIGPDLTELLEDSLLILERDAHAGVAHRDFGDAVRGGGANLDPSALGSELDRVRQGGEEDLLDLPLVSTKCAESVVHRGLESDPTANSALTREGVSVGCRMRMRGIDGCH